MDNSDNLFAFISEDKKSLVKAALSRVYVLPDRIKGDGLINRLESPNPANLAENRDPHCAGLRTKGGFLTVGELANRLGWDTKTVYSFTRRRRANRGLLPLPHKKIGRTLYFEWDKVVEWFHRQPGVELPEKGN